jgi:hypothetical protein
VQNITLNSFQRFKLFISCPTSYLAKVKKYIIPAIAILTFIAGLVSLMLPFLPFGWLLLAVSALLVVPYFEVMQRFIAWLSQKDTTGIVEKAGAQASKLYRWADDDQRADKLEDVIKENKAES